MTALNSSPALLVSVKDVTEAQTACRGGVDLLDIKNPDRGSLGMAAPETIAEIADWTTTLEKPPQLSAALGEAVDWFIESRLPRLPEQIAWCKLGLAGCGWDRNWAYHWQQLRLQWEEVSHPVNWVAVIYADWSEVNAPSPYDIVKAAIETRCTGVLLDTCQKDGRNLFDFLSSDQLQKIARRVRLAGLSLAVAGGLQAEHFPRTVELHPEILGFRTAACADDHRQGTCCETRIQELRTAMNASFRTAFV